MAHLESDVVVSASFAAQHVGVAQMPYVGVTNNVSENYNRVLKDFQSWKVHVCECSRPILILGFTQVQNVYITEINGIAVVLGLLLEISCKKRGIILYHK